MRSRMVSARSAPASCDTSPATIRPRATCCPGHGLRAERCENAAPVPGRGGQTGVRRCRTGNMRAPASDRRWSLGSGGVTASGRRLRVECGRVGWAKCLAPRVQTATGTLAEQVLDNLGTAAAVHGLQFGQRLAFASSSNERSRRLRCACRERVPVGFVGFEEQHGGQSQRRWPALQQRTVTWR